MLAFRSVAYLIVAVSIMATLTGCGGGGNNGDSAVSSRLISQLDGTTWKATSVTSASGQTATCPGSVGATSGSSYSCSDNEVYTFAAAGGSNLKETLTYNGLTASAVLPLKGNTVTSNMQGIGTPDYTTTISYVVNGSTMTITQVSTTASDPMNGAGLNGYYTTLTKQ